MAKNLEVMLERVRDKSIDFGRFVHATRSEFRAMAHALARKWKSPLLVDDIEQELYFHAWIFIWKFDPTRGVTIARFVVFNATHHAKRAMHKARGVSTSGCPDARVSRSEMPLSALGSDGDGEMLLAMLVSDEPKADEVAINVQQCRQAATRALSVCTSKKERYAVLAIREAGSLDNAGRLLYDDVDHRTTLRLGCESHAERFIVKHAGAVARRIAENELVRSI